MDKVNWIESIETRLVYLLLGIALGMVIATAVPLAQRWPSFEERLNMIEPGADNTEYKKSL